MRVIHVDDRGSFSPIGTAADIIAGNALEYCRVRGWEVDCILVGHPGRSQPPEAFRQRYPWLRSVELISAPPAAGEPSFRGQLSCYCRIARSARLSQILAEGADLFFTSSVFAAPLLERLPRRCKRLLAAQGLMADALAPSERLSNPGRDPLAPARDAFLRRIEMELYQLFDAVLFPNEDDNTQVGAEHPGRTFFVPQMMPWEIQPQESARGTTDPVAGAPFDLVFVGTSAARDVSGLTAFYRDVFVPYLRRHEVRLAVIGSVCEALDFDDWYVTKVGAVDRDLDGYYAHARVVVIPILEGSGLAIRTLESLARGRAVVSTAAGARGLAQDPDVILQVDIAADPGGSARTILELLDSEPLRKSMGQRARDYYQRHFGRERYFSAMDQVMSALGFAA